MTITNRREPLLLFVIDICLFFIALWLTLLLRYLHLPTADEFYNHLLPFSVLFFVWVIVFFIAGLYDKHTTLFRSRLPNTILNAQTVNVIIAALFFFLVPDIGITPKTSLGIYLIVSSTLIIFWRLYLAPRLSLKRQNAAILIAGGEEMEELAREVNGNRGYPFIFVAVIDPSLHQPRALVDLVHGMVQKTEAGIVVLDTTHKHVLPILPELYDLVFAGVRFIEASRVYEEVFDREPLTLLEHRWLVENISLAPRVSYDLVKRLIDLFFGALLGIISLMVYLPIALAIKLNDGGPVFIVQDRVGQNNRLIRLHKLRSMERNETDLLAAQSDNAVTGVGKFLRATRLDELPQLWNVLTGDLSLIGPRPELPSGVVFYEKEIPYYRFRHLIKPGLSGWAQLYHGNHPHHGAEVAATREKLSYDLYYIKHRSLLLDLKIALKTIKTLLSRSGI